MTGGMGSRPTKPTRDEWITPAYIIDALGGFASFTVDPCAAENMPWQTAVYMFTKRENGFNRDWRGRVWLNPPYGRDTGRWLGRLADHGDGIALIFARTETDDWHEHIWSKAHAVFFLRGRLTFAHTSGVLSKFNAGAPSALVAYGPANAESLEACKLPGKFITLRAWL